MSDTIFTREYHTVGEFLRELSGDAYESQGSGRHSEWRGCADKADAIRVVRDGYSKHLGMIDRLLDKVHATSPATAATTWEASVAGPLPIVPAAIAGLPDCMLAPFTAQSASAPLRVYVSVCLSAGCDEPVIAKRGAAIIALLQVLAKQRPVECWLFGDMGARNMFVSPLVKLETAPIDMATVSAALTSPAMLRELLFSFAHKHAAWSGQWAWDEVPGDVKANQRTRAAIGAADTDLVIHGGHLSDASEMIKTPETWVAKQVALTLAALEAAQ